MADLRQSFIRWYYNVFRLDPLYLDMDNVSEDSKWHRERTVGVHTDMVVAQYLTNGEDWTDDDIRETMVNWDYTDINAVLVCVFHDVGKPVSRTQKYKEDRGHYFAYSGHELASARLWEDYAVRNWIMLRDTFELAPEDIYRIGWLIENHRPWGLQRQDKLNDLATTVNTITTRHHYANILWADNKGRIGDNQAENEKQTADWINEFTDRCYNIPDLQIPEDAPTLIIMIGASGSGKSSVVISDEVDFQNFESFSLDELRLKWYGDDYAVAFEKSCDDNKFNNNAQQEYINLLKVNKSVCVDNTNLSRKRRRFYLTEAKRRGYKTIAMLLPVELQTVIDRQRTRTDKHVPDGVVCKQYATLCYPNFGEFDSILVNDCNLPD